MRTSGEPPGRVAPLQRRARADARADLIVTRVDMERLMRAGAGAYLNRVGPELATAFVGGMFEEAVRKHRNGFFDASMVPGNAARMAPVGGRAVINLNPAAPNAFHDWLKSLLAYEAGVVEVRRDQLEHLRKRAAGGDLSRELDRDVELRTDPESAGEELKVRFSPESVLAGERLSGSRVDRGARVFKAAHWVTAGRGIDNASDYKRLFRRQVRRDGTNPLGPDMAILETMWRELVTDAPLFRPPKVGSPYSSSVGGMHLMRQLCEKISERPTLPYRQPARENWALCMFGAIMRAQPFPDGNKRMARLAYGLMMASSGIPFRAPSDRMGSALAGM